MEGRNTSAEGGRRAGEAWQRRGRCGDSGVAIRGSTSETGPAPFMGPHQNCQEPAVVVP